LIVLLFVVLRSLKPLLNVHLKALKTAKKGLYMQTNCTVPVGKQDSVIRDQIY